MNQPSSNTNKSSQSDSTLSEPKQAPGGWGKRILKVSVVTCVLLGIFAFAFWYVCLRMPGESYVRTDAEIRKVQVNQSGGDTSAAGAQEEDGEQAEQVPSTEAELREYITHLGETIGERNLAHYGKLCETADYLEAKMGEWGYEVARQTYQVREMDCFNLDAEIKGTVNPEEIVIIGGHYDSFVGTPGANDNGSGTAATLALAHHFKDAKPDKTLRFVFWTNEEPPYFQNEGDMGSWVYAKRCRERKENVVAVLSLETMGFFTDAEDSQHYPAPLNLLYPSTGNFVGFVSNLNSQELQRRVIKEFREHAEIPSEGASLPDATPGVGWSDHWSFWQEDYVGIMVTDTAPFRYEHYHKATDTPDKINYPEMAKVVEGLKFVIEDLMNN